MGQIPDALRHTIAANIRACREQKFPGRGGAKQCAEAFGVSPQQWSPWERGVRTPDECRLEAIATFFDKSVDELRRPQDPPPSVQPAKTSLPLSGLSIPKMLLSLYSERLTAVCQIEISVTDLRFIRKSGESGMTK